MLGLCAVSASLVLPPPASKQEAGLVAAPLNKVTLTILGHLTFAVRAAALLLFRTCLVFFPFLTCACSCACSRWRLYTALRLALKRRTPKTAP